jgi:hypothetical protein
MTCSCTGKINVTDNPVCVIKVLAVKADEIPVIGVTTLLPAAG